MRQLSLLFALEVPPVLPVLRVGTQAGFRHSIVTAFSMPGYTYKHVNANG